jgi:hypothetical protein
MILNPVTDKCEVINIFGLQIADQVPRQKREREKDAGKIMLS